MDNLEMNSLEKEIISKDVVFTNFRKLYNLDDPNFNLYYIGDSLEYMEFENGIPAYIITYQIIFVIGSISFLYSDFFKSYPNNNTQHEITKLMHTFLNYNIFPLYSVIDLSKKINPIDKSKINIFLENDKKKINIILDNIKLIDQKIELVIENLNQEKNHFQKILIEMLKIRGGDLNNYFDMINSFN